jgi:hypothetical protein
MFVFLLLQALQRLAKPVVHPIRHLPPPALDGNRHQDHDHSEFGLHDRWFGSW